MFRRRKEPKREERRKPENAKMRKEFNTVQKSETSTTLKVVQEQMKDTDVRIENLRKIARLGAIKGA